MNAATKILRDAKLLPLKAKVVTISLVILSVLVSFVGPNPHYF